MPIPGLYIREEQFKIISGICDGRGQFQQRACDSSNWARAAQVAPKLAWAAGAVNVAGEGGQLKAKCWQRSEAWFFLLIC